MNSLKITRDANFDNISINGSYNVPIVNSLIELQTMDTIGNIVFVNSENNFYFHLKNGWSPLGSGGGELPLTTKGDLLAYDTDYTRLPVGIDNQVLTADSSETTGVKWTDLTAGVALGDRVVTVGVSGCDYTTPTLALAAITDAAANKRYMVLVTPGEYGGFTGKAYVEVRGLSRDECIINSLVTMAGVDCTLANLTISRIGGMLIMTGLSDNWIIRQVTGIGNVDSTMTLVGLYCGGTLQDIELTVTCTSYDVLAVNGIEVGHPLGSAGLIDIDGARVKLTISDADNASGTGLLGLANAIIVTNDADEVQISNGQFKIDGTSFTGYDAGVYFRAGRFASVTTVKHCVFTSPNNGFYGGVDNHDLANTYIGCTATSWLNTDNMIKRPNYNQTTSQSGYQMLYSISSWITYPDVSTSIVATGLPIVITASIPITKYSTSYIALTLFRGDSTNLGNSDDGFQRLYTDVSQTLHVNMTFQYIDTSPGIGTINYYVKYINDNTSNWFNGHHPANAKCQAVLSVYELI